MTSPNLVCVGNAIVDILIKVEDSFLKSNNLNKGSMSLVNNEEFDKIISKFSKYKIKSGGSAANTAVGYSSIVWIHFYQISNLQDIKYYYFLI